MQHEVSEDTAALLLNVGVLSQGQALIDHSVLHIELKAKVQLTPLSLLFSFSVLQWLHLHVASLCTCMRLTQSSITINQSHFLCGSWSFFTLLACVLVSVCMCVCVFVCIHFADMQAGGHPSRRQAGEGGKRGGGCMRAVVQKYREELLLALAVSAVAVARPKQLQSIHPHFPLPLHPTSPLLLIPLRFHPTSKEVCDMASAELAGRLELLHLGPSTVSYRVNIQQGSWKAKQLCPFFFFESCHLPSGTLAVWHTLACSQPLRRHFRFSEIMVQQIV